jgi:NADP-dependent 3-hydroxy acid dehydrogenase YdfG
MKSLAGHVAVVTGGGSGIGKAIAGALGACGADLLLVGRTQSSLEQTAHELRSHGRAAQSYPTDLASGDQVRRLISQIKEDSEHVDIIVHCAAAIVVGSLANARSEDFELQYRTNVMGAYLLTQGLLTLIRDRRGQIVFLNSSAGLMAHTNVGQYTATKHALKAIADCLREEVNGDRIRVLSVFPGRTATPLQRRLHVVEGREYRPERLLQPEDVASVVVSALCLPRTAEVTDINIRSMSKPE